MSFRFYLPTSRAVPGGVIACDFSVAPIAREEAGDQELNALHRRKPTLPQRTSSELCTSAPASSG